MNQQAMSSVELLRICPVVGAYTSTPRTSTVVADGPAGGALVSRMPESPNTDGYSVRLEGGKVHVQLTKRWLDDALNNTSLVLLFKVGDRRLLLPG